METNHEQIPTPENDYFANRLLDKLDVADPVFAAYEAQDISRSVGFDFDSFQDVVPRALDEIRETKEAYEEGPEGHEHLGDEIADIMFSLINLARHAGRTELSPFSEIIESAKQRVVEAIDTPSLVDDIGSRIAAVAEIERAEPEKFIESLDELFHKGMEDGVLLAWANGFEPETLLKDNVRKYLIRCQAIETLAAEDNKLWTDLAEGNEIPMYWKKAKSLLK